MTSDLSDDSESACVYPSCVVTRSMKCNEKLDGNKHDINLAETIFGKLFNDEHVIRSKELSDFVDSEAPIVSTERDFIKEQSIDPDISPLFRLAVSEKESYNLPICYYTKNGILLRKYRPPMASVDEEWSVKHQIVVPKRYRNEVLSLGHDSFMAGHLGINKTLNKILNHFYWPKLRSDVIKYCRSCHACQLVGKPNQTIPKAPLQPIPVIQEPFSKIIIDCVGPLPKTKSGNQYLFTIMCAATRFPEAVPVRNIKVKSIIKALINFFTVFGLPKIIQSDQGTNFTSHIFRQISTELGCNHVTSSAYHPESQGALERFHQTFKNMLRIYCFQTEKDWDQGIQFLLFAIRDSVQESLYYSPFELVFGHTVRGPLKLLKEKILLASDQPNNVAQYVLKIRDQLKRACEIAQGNLQIAQKKMKSSYDKKSVERIFGVGDKVLILLPVPGNPLQSRYFGPYTIESKISDVNYIVKTPDRRKTRQLCHVNLIKKYVERDKDGEKVEQSINLCTSYKKGEEGLKTEDCEEIAVVLGESVVVPAKLCNSHVLRNLEAKLIHLEESKKEDIKSLLLSYKELFSDNPRQTNMIFHDIEITNETPIKQHPYRVNPTKQQLIDNEIDYMLKNGLIEPSNSAWSSPCILIPKPDNTYRFCTDYRKINSISKSDSFPIPRMDDCIDRVGQAKYVTRFDLLKGFWQIPLTSRAKEISAFVTHRGLYQYKVMPFGMKNAPMTFQRLVNRLTREIDGCECYIDDIVLHHNDWQEHLKSIIQFFNRLTEANLTINLVKSEFGCAQVTFLGHVVGKGQVKPINAKVEAIINFSTPSNKRDLMRFLGMAGYYRRFCQNFSIVSEPLTNLLRKNAPYNWNDKCNQAFLCLKAMLKNEPILMAPSFDKEFKLYVDASDVGAGAVLTQDDNFGFEHPVCYFSKKFDQHQRNYSTIEKECLSLILALQQFEVYVSATSNPTIVYSDHNPLVFINKMKNKNQRLLRWSLLIQQYDLEIRHIKGKENVVADSLSRSLD